MAIEQVTCGTTPQNVGAVRTSSPLTVAAAVADQGSQALLGELLYNAKLIVAGLTLLTHADLTKLVKK